MEVSYACLQATKNPRWAYNYWHSYILDGFSVLQMTIYATLVSCRSDDLVVQWGYSIPYSSVAHQKDCTIADFKSELDSKN